MLEPLIEAARSAEQTGAWDDAIRKYEEALFHLPRDPAGDPARAAEILRWIGTVHRERGELEIACELYEASLAVAQAGRLRDQMASGLNCLAIVEQFAGQMGRAEALYLRSREIAEEVEELDLVAMIDQNLGTLANIRGDLEGAKRHYFAALFRFHTLGDDLSAARLLNNLGMAQVDAGEWHDAEESFDRAFSIADRLHHLVTLGSIELNRSDLYLQQREYARAREHCDRAFEVFGRLDSKTGLGEAHKLYGVLHRETSKWYLAEMHLLLALELARSSQDRLLEAEVERERALLATAQAQDREALECLNRARRLFTELQAGPEVLDVERKVERLEKDYLEVVTRWVDSMEAADRYTAGHSRRVADLSCRLAEAAGAKPGEMTPIRVGALLHDLGKLTIPPDVLNKAGPLTPREWEMIREHPVTGERMIADKGLPWKVRPIVRGHHEHWDGSGYPDRLAGENIPFGARILRIADSFDALTHARSYRPALDREEALRVMEREAGRALDPELFATFRRMMEG